MRSCIMPGLPTHLVQELNVGTVYRHSFHTSYACFVSPLAFGYVFTIIYRIVSSFLFVGRCIHVDMVCYDRKSLTSSIEGILTSFIHKSS